MTLFGKGKKGKEKARESSSSYADAAASSSSQAQWDYPDPIPRPGTPVPDSPQQEQFKEFQVPIIYAEPECYEEAYDDSCDMPESSYNTRRSRLDNHQQQQQQLRQLEVLRQRQQSQAPHERVHSLHQPYEDVYQNPSQHLQLHGIYISGSLAGYPVRPAPSFPNWPPDPNHPRWARQPNAVDDPQLYRERFDVIQELPDLPTTNWDPIRFLPKTRLDMMHPKNLFKSNKDDKDNNKN